MRNWIGIWTALSVGLLCWIGSGHLPGWGQSPPPDLNSLPPQERIEVQAEEQIDVQVSPSPPSIETPAQDQGSEPEILPLVEPVDQPDPPRETPPLTIETPLLEPVAEPEPPSEPSFTDPLSTENFTSFLDPNLTLMMTRPGITIRRLGNLHYATIRLDGYALIEIATEVPNEDLSRPEELLPIYSRVEQIQNRLSRIVSQSIRMNVDPRQFQVSKAILNDEVVLVMTHGERRNVLLTVSQPDATLSNTSIDELADRWVPSIKTALIRAWIQRQSVYIQAQLKWAAFILFGTILLSFLLIQIQRWAKSIWDNKQQQAQDIFTLMDSANASDLPDLPEDLTSIENNENLRRLRRHQDLLFLLRLVLFFKQVMLWAAGITLILIRFPQSRDLGLQVFGFPFFVIMLLLLINLSSRILKLMIDYHFGRWLEEQKKKDSSNSPRPFARAQTYSFVCRGIVNSLSAIVFFMALLYNLEIPISSLLTGAGIVGIFLSLATQNMIKNILSGFGVLMEDQYALGDWITINDTICGIVEHIDLVYTKVRDLNGSIVTIANGEISKVENMSVDWARVWFSVDVAYQTDIDKAIQILQLESQALAKDAQWKSAILNPVEVVGVDRLAHDGMRLRLWIQTKAGLQFAVERELRRRLRIAFEKHSISIGIPQQEIPQLNNRVPPF